MHQKDIEECVTYYCKGGGTKRRHVLEIVPFVDFARDNDEAARACYAQYRYKYNVEAKGVVYEGPDGQIGYAPLAVFANWAGGRVYAK